MSDADTAYKIAEQRIERVRAEGLKHLCLSPFGHETDGVKWKVEGALEHLAMVPPSISSLTEVTRLHLRGTQVADITPLAGMVEMQTLLLDSTQVADITPLVRMVGMQRLDLQYTQVADVTPLEGMVAMKELRLQYTQVADISPLSGMVWTQALYLSKTKVKDITPLSRMVWMKLLTLSGTQVVDITPLAGMVRMKGLHLHGTQVANITPLSVMIGMKELNLSGAQVDLSGLVAPDAAWEREDHELERLYFAGVPVEDEVLATLRGRSGMENVGPETLARLRELRDMAAPPAAVRAPVPTGPFTFLSYAHTDRPAAFRLKSALEEEGLSIWWDQMIDPGMDWDAELRRRVKAAHSVLVLWSEASAASEHVRDEAQRARRANTIAPVMIEPLSEDQLPQPFGGRHTLDLSHWNGARDDEVFQRLVKFLKLRQIGAQSPVTTRFNDDGLLELAERPVGAAPLREDEVRRSRLLRSQADLSRDMAGVIEEEVEAKLVNHDRRLVLRTTFYERALRSNEDLIWETLNASFQRANGLIRWDELDEGMKPTVQTWRDQHGALQEFIQPAQPPEDQALDDQVSPDDVAEVMEELAEVAADLEAAASAEIDAAPVTAPIPRLLQSHAERMARERDDPDGPSEASEQAGRSRTGKTVRAALGVLTGVAAGVTVHSWAVTGPGAPLLNKMVALAEKLFALL